MRKWLLPEHIEDVLPPEAARIERARSAILEVFRTHGYELVMPPMLEYIDSLLTGTGHDLDLRTFKLVDQLSGRMMGIRADITPQVARIDSHLLNRDCVTRLCYCGSVLHTRPRGLDATREPIQIGAELYGHSGIESDLEIQRLLAATLDACGIRNRRLDIGHVGIFRAICRGANIGQDLESALHEALEGKDHSTIEMLSQSVPKSTRDAFLELPRLYGGKEVLLSARQRLPQYPEVGQALDDLERLASDNHFDVSIDLADLRGYQYHSGVIFAAYPGSGVGSENHPGCHDAIALGGRYDEVGKAFGRARAATGFSLDLRDVARFIESADSAKAIRAPYSSDKQLNLEINRLRNKGECVVQSLPGAKEGVECDRELYFSGERWLLRPTNNDQ